jgi:hypothetical protein
LFFVFCFFWFPLMTQFSWPAECVHGIEHVVCVQVSIGFYFVLCMSLSFLRDSSFVRGTLLVCLLRFLFRFLHFFFVLRLSEAFAACLCLFFCEGLLARA